jgi:hypothetical protein
VVLLVTGLVAVVVVVVAEEGFFVVVLVDFGFLLKKLNRLPCFSDPVLVLTFPPPFAASTTVVLGAMMDVDNKIPFQPMMDQTDGTPSHLYVVAVVLPRPSSGMEARPARSDGARAQASHYGCDAGHPGAESSDDERTAPCDIATILFVTI